MLTLDGCRTRLQRLRDRLDNPWDALIIHRPEHLLYFANVFPSPSTINVHSSSFLLVEREGPVTLYTDNWIAETAEAAVDKIAVTTWYDMKHAAQPRAHAVASALCERLRGLNVGLLGAELSHLPVQVAAPADSVVDIEPTIQALREIKDPDEIAAIQRGIRTAEAFHAASRHSLRAGKTELEYYGELLGPATVAAGAPMSMMCDLASGQRAAQGGGGPTPRVLQEGELVILDIFPYVEGYRGDITNTLVVGGEPSSEQQELFEVVLAAQQAGEALLKSGTGVGDVFRAMSDTIERAGHPALSHHGGHAIGLGHPEAPEIVPESDRLLEEGMVITLEPGVYKQPTGGIRLEHNYLIRAEGFDRLSNHRLGLS